jgi:type II secretion system protein H
MSSRGVTLIEMLVVLMLIALIGSVAGPFLSQRFDAIKLQSTATELAAQLKRAQAVARADQVPIAMTYTEQTFRFWKSSKPVAVYTLPSSISPVVRDFPTYVFLPSGQILGADVLELRNERGRRVTIKTDSLSGISVSFGAAL